MPSNDRMRDEFEAWIILRPLHCDAIAPLFEAWQAACRARAKRDAEICRKLTPIIVRTHDATLSWPAQHDDCAKEIEKDAGL